MRVQDYVQNNIAYHDTLNPVAWQGDRMHPEVRLKLLKIAHVFVDYIEIADFNTLDIVLTGSMANYNWTKFSDFDIHVVTRYSDLECDDIVAAFYQAKKQIWNKQHDILIRGHEAELYVEDIDQPPVSGGIYSLLRGEWLKQPNHDVPDIDSRAVNIKVQDLIHQIDDALDTANGADDIKRVTDKIRKMRRVGLDRAGEFSVENLAFKVLRNEGYIDRLSQAHLHQQDAELSLAEAGARSLPGYSTSNPLHSSWSRVLSRQLYEAKRKGFEVNITAEDAWNVINVQGWKCALTGAAFVPAGAANPNQASLDRIDSKQGYVHGNIRYVTYRVNMFKKDWPDDIFFALCKQVANYRS